MGLLKRWGVASLYGLFVGVCWLGLDFVADAFFQAPHLDFFTVVFATTTGAALVLHEYAPRVHQR